jgi:hypothetical protein
MINQSGFYKTITTFYPKITIVKKFRQLGSGGYLPVGSQGTCSFTTLDFHRAVSQDVLSTWYEKAGKHQGGGLRHFGRASPTNFGARQQMYFENPSHIHKDPLFAATIARKEILEDGISNKASRERLDGIDGFEPDYLSNVLNESLKQNQYLRLNFTVNSSGTHFGHTIAICNYPNDLSKIFVMDPNAGVFSIDKQNLEIFITILQNRLYHSYTLGDSNIEIQYPFWLDENTSLTQEQKVLCQKNEALLHESTSEGCSYIDKQQSLYNENKKQSYLSDEQLANVEFEEPGDMLTTSDSFSPIDTPKQAIKTNKSVGPITNTTKPTLTKTTNHTETNNKDIDKSFKP